MICISDLKRLYFTDEDLDGVCCAYILQKVIGEGTIVFSSKALSTDMQLLETLENNSFDEIYITDVVPKLDSTLSTLDNLYAHGIKVQLIDHHLSGIAINDYNWGYVCSEKNGRKECATSLVVEYLKDKKLINNEYDTLSEIVRKYDTWSYIENDDRLGEDLTRLMTILSFDEIFVKFERIFCNETVLLQKDIEQLCALKSFYARYIEENRNNARIGYTDKYKYIVCYSNLPSFSYIVIEELLKNDETLDFGINIDLLHNLINLKTFRNDLDMSKIAKLNEGGGQKIVAGFRVPPNSIDYILNNIAFDTI